MPQRRVWINRLVVAALVVLPVTLFFVTQAISNSTRSGNVDEAWFARTPQGPLIVVRDRIVVGTERSSKTRHRVAIVDARTGERLARETMPMALGFVGAKDGALWFRSLADGKVLAFDRELDSRPAEGEPPPQTPSHHPAGTRVTVGGATWVTPGMADGGVKALPAAWKDAAILVDATSGEAITFGTPPSFFTVHKGEAKDTLVVGRHGEDGEALWTETLDRQRALKAATVEGDLLLLVSAGAARDFAFGLELATGKTRWVHSF